AAAAGGGWAAVCEKFRTARTLSTVESRKDPETEPYRSKYSARALLQEVKQLLSAAEEGGEARLLAVRRAVLEYELGVNHTDTEELSAGEEHLQRCTQLLEPHRLSPDCVSLYIQAQNNLGILWSLRDEIKTAQTYLESAEALYNQYMKEDGNPPLDPSEHFMAEEEKITDQERSKRFEKAYTHTLYYLAQVYQHLEMIEKAAQYCHTTLKRQLEYCGYNPVEWALNAATLSQYYLSKQCFMEARHCLAAASVIFSQAGQVPSAEDSKSYLYCLLLLDAAASLTAGFGVVALLLVVLGIDVLNHKVVPLQRSIKETSRELTTTLRATCYMIVDICDSVLAIEEKVSSVYPLDFQEAREIFLVGQNYVLEAKEFFQVDGYVTDHIEIVQDHSALFKVLAFFEEDYERRCKMHKRRLDMLESIYVDLNPQYYLLISRQLQFELADTYYEMMDLKIAIGNRLEELDSHTIKKINSLAQLAIKYYELFLDSLRNPDRVFPEQLEEDVLRPAMVAKFHIARLYGKLITSDSKKQLENMQTSLEYYMFLVDYCEKYPDAVRAVETELELSKEMVGLLPTRMERLRAKLCPFI
ncbi:KBP protein, partial [Phaetusa simplex]|nr:KBP protein [Phaetusa simplex]